MALGVAAASAVLTGALLVGASMRGSLKALTLDRLNRVDEFLVTQQFFQSTSASQCSSDSCRRRFNLGVWW